jgi:hypothetical protein
MEEDRPPERIWLNDDELTAHFEAVENRRSQGAAGIEAVPAADMEQNELTADFRK